MNKELPLTMTAEFQQRLKDAFEPLKRNLRRPGRGGGRQTCFWCDSRDFQAHDSGYRPCHELSTFLFCPEHAGLVDESKAFHQICMLSYPITMSEQMIQMPPGPGQVMALRMSRTKHQPIFQLLIHPTDPNTDSYYDWFTYEEVEKMNPGFVATRLSQEKLPADYPEALKACFLPRP